MLNRLTRPQSPAKGPMFSYQYDQDQLQSTTITVRVEGPDRNLDAGNC